MYYKNVFITKLKSSFININKMKISISYGIFVLLFVRTYCISFDANVFADLISGTYRLVRGLFEDVMTPLTPMDLDSYKDEAEAFQSLGYRFEIHKIRTEDGYTCIPVLCQMHYLSL